MEHKMISVVIATYNPIKEWFQQTLDSCIGIDEIIIIDDKSSHFDIGDYKLPAGIKVELLCNEVNLGSFKAYNKGVNYAHGDWISGQADDDFFDKDNFPRILEIVRKSKADVVYFPCLYFGKYNYIYGRNPNLNFNDIYNANNIYGTSFFRKTMWELLEGFQVEVGFDWDFWLRALKSGFKFEYVDLIGGHFRVTERSMFENMLKKLGRDEINRIVHENVDRWNKVYDREKIEAI